MFESLFNKVADLSLHAHLNFIFLQGKPFKNVKCKVMFTEAYLEPSRTSMMELFAR